MPILSRWIDRRQNNVVLKPPYAVQLEAFTLHQSLFVVDLHADALMWNRDLLRRNRSGHVDLPRLLSGNVALQVFGVVTKFPYHSNFVSNKATRADLITALAVLQRWPLRTWRSLFNRALFQAARLERFAQASGGKLVLVRTRADLENLRQRRAARVQVVGGFPSLEGVHALQGRLERLDRLYAAGFRMIGLTHFFDNEAAGSMHGVKKTGLTPFGREVVRRTRELHMVLDLAHAAPKVIDEVLEMDGGPLVVSHTGVKGHFDSPRNLSDEQVKRIAAAGGIIGITLLKGALPEPRLEQAVQAMRYTADLVGVEYVAFGSDFDGVVTEPVDASGLALLTEAMLAAGFNAGEISRILGENALRVLNAVLPAA